MGLWRIEQITTRFLVIAVSAAAVLAVLVAGAVSWRQFESERRRQNAAMTETARLNAIALQEPMWAINDRATRTIIGSLAAHPGIVCAEVAEPQGRLLAATDTENGCGTPTGAEPVVAQVVYENHLLGHLTLWVDSGALLRTARADARLSLLVFLTLAAAMAVSAVFALRATVMRPLDRLNHAISRAAKVADNPRPDDELGRVITAYNSLLDRIEAHNAELEDARAQAVAAAQAKSRFLATMSHEIRTPMHGVLGTVELLRETALNREQRKLADIIWTSTESLLGIINDILDLSKIEAGQVRMAMIATDPRHVLQEAIAALEATARAKGLPLVLECDAAIPDWVLADPLRLRQVVTNLVGNAVKFTERGHVRLSLRQRDQDMEIAVADTGIGIRPDDLARLFQPFRQVDASTTRRHGGTGLGLSISRQLVELMGGHIEVRSRPGEGSVFRVVLPLVAADPPEDGGETPAVPRALGGGIVLAAEDNPVNQWLLRSQLDRLGYGADIHPDGAAALAAFRRGGEYVAIVTDYHMPIMDGLDLARAIRAAEMRDGGRRHIPIIGMTADAFAETTEECLRAGMDMVVTKPVSLQDLGAALSRQTAGAAVPPIPCAPSPSPASPDDAPLLDAEITAVLFGDDPAARVEMAALYATTADDLRTRLNAHLSGGDAGQLGETAHSLASAALSLGATRLGLAARALEHAAKNDDWIRIRTLAARVAVLDVETRAALVGR